VRDLAETLSLAGPGRFTSVSFGDALSNGANFGNRFFGAQSPQGAQLGDRQRIAGDNDRLARLDAVDHLGKTCLGLGQPDSHTHVTSLAFVVKARLQAGARDRRTPVAEVVVIAIATVPAAMDAYSIWLQARSAVTSAQYPRRIAYTIAITGFDGETPAADHYRAVCSPDDGSIRVFSISDEQLAQPPPVPHGVDTYFTISLSEGRNAPAVVAIPMGHPAPYQDFLGWPILAPTYAFGMRYNAAGTASSPSGESSLRVIAIVSAQAPEYRVTLIDTPVIDGVATYHLGLAPLRRPKDNRLRELWVGESDYLPRKAVIAGNFTTAPLVDVPWTVDFSIVNGAPYIARERAEQTLYLAHHRVVRNAVVAFENIREPDGSLYDTPLIEPETDDTTLVEPTD
jgi:hypothetical protein